MSRWGARKWGTFLWGSETTANLLWAIEVDWDGNGIFDGSSENWAAQGLTIRRGRRQFVRADGVGFEPYAIGDALVTLLNDPQVSSTGVRYQRYNPFDVNSPLYPNVEPGKYIRIRIRNGYSGKLYNVFSGTVNDIRPFRRDGHEFVLLSCKDGWELLNNAVVSTGVYGGKKTGECLDVIFGTAANIGWPDIWGTDFSIGADVIPYWWLDGENSATAIHDLVQSECGKFALLATGQARFRSRSDASASVITIDQSQVGTEIGSPSPWETRRNVINVPIYQTVGQVSTQLWQLDEVPLLKAGESLTVTGNFKFENKPCAATSISGPTASTDYTANSSSDGLGVDLTGDFNVTVDKLYSQSITLTVTNGGVGDGYLTFLQVRGTPITIPNSTAYSLDVSAGKIRRFFSLDTKMTQTLSRATARAAYLANLLNVTRQFPVFTIEALPDVQFAFDISDRITLNFPSIGIENTDFLVSYIEHEWLIENGQTVRTTVQVEPFAAGGATTTTWIWPITWGLNTTWG